MVGERLRVSVVSTYVDGVSKMRRSPRGVGGESKRPKVNDEQTECRTRASTPRETRNGQGEEIDKGWIER